jgi:hypothetical protein
VELGFLVADLKDRKQESEKGDLPHTHIEEEKLAVHCHCPGGPAQSTRMACLMPGRGDYLLPPSFLLERVTGQPPALAGSARTPAERVSCSIVVRPSWTTRKCPVQPAGHQARWDRQSRGWCWGLWDIEPLSITKPLAYGRLNVAAISR